MRRPTRLTAGESPAHGVELRGYGDRREKAPPPEVRCPLEALDHETKWEEART